MKRYKKYLILILLAFIIEIGCFNFNSLLSYSYKPVEYKTYYGENFVSEDGYHKTNGTETGYNYTVELFDIDDYVYNIYIDYYTEIEKGASPAEFVVTIADQGSEVLYWNPANVVVNNDASKYLKINASGKTDRIVIEFDRDSEATTYIYSIKLNQRRPINISKTRLILILMILILFSVYRDNSELYRLANKKIKNILLVLFVIIQIILLFNISTVNNKYIIEQSDTDSNSEYQLLAHSLASRKVYFDLEVSEELKQMENPYDSLSRSREAVDYNFDFAYYEGKYYMYFGIVPEVLFFLPYYLITGNDLMNYIAVFISLSLFAVGIVLLLKDFIRKYFPDTPFIMYLLFAELSILASGIIELAKNPSTYAIPIASALTFMVWGLYFWCKSADKKINRYYLLAGSICMALVFGCRPQLGLSSLFAFIIFKKHFKDYKSLVIALIPFAIIGSLLMYYNYIRFDSVIDFGSTYNLTFNDMTKRGFKLDRIGLGLFTYLVQPVNLTATFPFVTAVETTTNYIGRTIYEQTFGGLIFWFPLSLLSLFVYRIRKYFKHINLYYMVIALNILAIFTVIVDVQGAGIVQRYFADFSLYILMSTVICLLVIVNKYKNNKLNYIIFILVVLTITYSLMLLFVKDFAAIEKYNHDFYYKWYYILQPWL